MIFLRQMHIYSMSATSVPNLELFAQELWKDLITQTLHPEVAIA